MKVLVDTCIWSLALRRQNNHINNKHIQYLTDLINENRIVIIGPIRQELLSGIREEAQFIKLKSNLSAFPDIPLETQDYEKAAEFCNQLRKKGIQGTTIDYIICAIAYRYRFTIYTSDKDFLHYQQYIPITIGPV